MRVVVQHQKRLLREGLALLLSACDQVVLRATAETTGALLHLCRLHRPDVVLMEVDAVDDPHRFCRRLRREAPGVRVVGLCGAVTTLDSTQADAAGVRLVPPRCDFAAVLDAVRAVPQAGSAPVPPDARVNAFTDGSDDAPPLTAREKAILLLVGGGCTSQSISHQLQISPKTVENHKQRIFAKLGVQNQAHAVAVAIREGLITPERMMSAVAD